MKYKKLCEEIEKLSQQVATIKETQRYNKITFDCLKIRIDEIFGIVDNENFIDQVVERIKRKQLK